MKPVIFLEKQKPPSLSFERKKIEEKYLLWGFFFLMVIGAVILLFRLFELTIIKGYYYFSLAEDNRIKELIIEAPRGTIKDRKGFDLAYNLFPEFDNILAERFPSRRLYPEDQITAPLVGYRQIADKNDLKNDLCLEKKLDLGDKVGKKGIEKIFECRLRGKNGKKLVETNASGKIIKELAIIKPQPGETIQLALDLELQKKAFELMGSRPGAIVALKPQNNEVLILYSSPSFSSQDFEDGRTEGINKILSDPNRPLFNRALEGVYPPGSVFKLAVAVAALEEKAITEKTLIEDTGIVQAGPLKFGNWYFLEYGKTDGMVDVVKAIQRSNDIFFYRIGEKTGLDKLRRWAETLGLGQKTKIGLPEAEGLIPSSFWKESVIKERWYLGDTYNFSIGQGYLLATPLQLAVLTSIFANQGNLCQPQLLKNAKPVCQKLSLSQKTLALVTEGMIKACSPGGTGWPLFNFKVKDDPDLPQKDNLSTSQAKLKEIKVACKTGTAEAQSKKHKPHAWIVVFAPAEKPEIILSVLVENAGQGSEVAGPVAKELLRAYFERSF